MPDPFVRARARGCGAQVLVLVAAFVVVAGVLVVSTAVAVLAPSGDARLFAFLGVFTLFVLAIPPLAIGFAVFRTRSLDPTFQRLGLTPSGWLPNIREFHGTVDGRQVDVFFSRRGPLLQFTVASDARTTLSIGTRTAIGAALRSVVGGDEVQDVPEVLAPYLVRAAEPAWATAALADPQVRDLSARLLSEPLGRELRVLAVRPGAVQLTRNYFSMPPEEIEAQVSDLCALSTALSRVSLPAHPVPLSSLERTGRANPTRTGVLIAFGLVGGTMALVTLIGGVALALSTLSQPSSPPPAPQAHPSGVRGR